MTLRKTKKEKKGKKKSPRPGGRGFSHINLKTLVEEG